MPCVLDDVIPTYCPALCTTTSSRPPSPLIRSTAEKISSRVSQREMSPPTHSARRSSFADLRDDTNSSAASLSELYVRSRSYPPSDRTVAMPEPMPLVPPVTRAMGRPAAASVIAATPPAMMRIVIVRRRCFMFDTRCDQQNRIEE